MEAGSKLPMAASNLLILKPLILHPSARFRPPKTTLLLAELRARQHILCSFPTITAHLMTAPNSELVLVPFNSTRIALTLARCILPICFAFLLSQGQHCEAVPSQPIALTRSASSASAEQFEPVSNREKEASDAFVKRVQQAVSWLEKGRNAQVVGDFKEALLWYTQITESDGDLALAEYARVGRALSLYELGEREQAFLEMEDLSQTLKGYPEVHAALAAALYVDKHSLVSAEQQFNIATMLDPHYADLFYVKDTRHWPPSLIEALKKFISLQ